MVPNKNTQGFTLIELVVVIVILGILAATVAPKFIDLQADARTSTLEGVKAAMEGASALVYSKSLIKGNQKLSSLQSPTITLSDGNLNIGYGYPLSSIDDWQRLIELNSNDFLLTKTIDGSVVVYLAGSDKPVSSFQSCLTAYKRVGNVGDIPSIKTNPCL